MKKTFQNWFSSLLSVPCPDRANWLSLQSTFDSACSISWPESCWLVQLSAALPVLLNRMGSGRHSVADETMSEPPCLGGRERTSPPSYFQFFKQAPALEGHGATSILGYKLILLQFCLPASLFQLLGCTSRPEGTKRHSLLGDAVTPTFPCMGKLNSRLRQTVT